MLRDAELVIRETGLVVESILSESMLAAWVRGNEQVLKVAPAIDIPPGLLPPSPPGKDLITPPDAPEPIVRFPVIEKAAERLHDATIVSPQEFRQLDTIAREKAFTITTRMTDNSVDQIRQLLSENIAKGADREAFIADVQEMFKEGLDLSEARIEQVFRNNVNGAFSDGQEKALNHILVRDAFPYRRYSATLDQRVRPEHAILERSGLNGTSIYRADDPVWQLFRPPFAWNCRCSGSPVSIQSAARGGVQEAIDWIARAERDDLELFQTPPEVPEFVDHPTFEGVEFFPPPEWIRGRPVGLTS